MNYIKQLQEENLALKQQIKYAQDLAIEFLAYYNSDKFRGVGNDYAHVSTDVYTKMNIIKMLLNVDMEPKPVKHVRVVCNNGMSY